MKLRRTRYFFPSSIVVTSLSTHRTYIPILRKRVTKLFTDARICADANQIYISYSVASTVITSNKVLNTVIDDFNIGCVYEF